MAAPQVEDPHSEPGAGQVGLADVERLVGPGRSTFDELPPPKPIGRSSVVGVDERRRLGRRTLIQVGYTRARQLQGQDPDPDPRAETLGGVGGHGEWRRWIGCLVHQSSREASQARLVHHVGVVPVGVELPLRGSP